MQIRLTPNLLNFKNVVHFLIHFICGTHQPGLCFLSSRDWADLGIVIHGHPLHSYECDVLGTGQQLHLSIAPY